MTDLTDKWKKGELPYAEYYIKLAGGEYTNDVWDFDGWQSFNKKGDVVVEVLAPVPSFEQWQAKLEENAQLKELLRECLAHLTIGKYGTSVTPINILCDEVEEVLK